MIPIIWNISHNFTGTYLSTEVSGNLLKKLFVRRDYKPGKKSGKNRLLHSLYSSAGENSTGGKDNLFINIQDCISYPNEREVDASSLTIFGSKFKVAQKEVV